MNYTPERANAIAAEYVLGTLPSRARTRVARLIATDLLTHFVQALETCAHLPHRL